MGYVVQGTVWLRAKDISLRAEPGTVFFHSPHNEAGMSTEGPVKLLHCHLSSPTPPMVVAGDRLVEWAHSVYYASDQSDHAHTVAIPDHLQLRRGALAEQLLMSVIGELDDPRPGAALAATAQFLLFLRLVTEETIRAIIETPDPGSEQSSNRHVRAAVEYLESNLSRPLTPRMVALHLGLNPDYLGRLFQRYIGESIGHYLMKRRIAVARQLLSSSDIAIKQVAARVGVSDQFYFSRLFRREVGCSPREYQQTQRSL